jgi:acetyl-CoA carboxylase biotin carboxyl carrier protein
MAKTLILSPLPGTFYRRPAPDKPPYKNVDDNVGIGDVVGLVEVMKTFYEVKSEVPGKITHFHIENEEAIQAGQPIADVES